MNRNLTAAVLFCSALLLSGCSSYGQQEQTGMVIGGALGGLLGSQVSSKHDDWRTAAIIAGTMAGAAVLAAEVEKERIEKRMKTRYLDWWTSDLDQAIRDRFPLSLG